MSGKIVGYRYRSKSDSISLGVLQSRANFKNLKVPIEILIIVPFGWRLETDCNIQNTQIFQDFQRSRVKG